MTLEEFIYLFFTLLASGLVGGILLAPFLFYIFTKKREE